MAKKDITNTDLVKIEPITDNQKLVFDSYAKGQHQFMFGSAGTGKTFISPVSYTHLTLPTIYSV